MLRKLMKIPGFMRLWHHFPLGSVPLRTEYDVWDRPNYAYGMYWAAFQAQALGPVSETVPPFLATPNFPPIGFISFDLDYYNSTKQAFQIFAGRAEMRLPRIYCYFDDIVFPPWACHNDHVGELLAIREFNQE